ncbi:MAG: hypothetical protein M3258_01435 [Thermoproteota archaeon]|nr:hypothetical protein [Thermoproteota archaeon]
MSHRLEKSEDTKYSGNYKEPKTPHTYSTIKPDAKTRKIACQIDTLTATFKRRLLSLLWS